MAVVRFYEKPGCATNARQKRLLAASGHEVVPLNLLTEAWSAVRLRPFFAGMAVAEWFNRAAPRVKSGAVVPEAMEAETALALLVADPLLIRRPLIEVAGRRAAGFDRDRLDGWIGLADESVDGALDGCSHQGAALPSCPGPSDGDRA
jgi:nitrogenase-associated protein